MKMHFIWGAAALALLPAAGFPERIYAVDEVGNLIRFDSVTPGVIESSVPLTGLELDSYRGLAALDFRPATGRLYALVDQVSGIGIPPPGAEHCDLYWIEPETGASFLVGMDDALTEPWVRKGFDFSPVANEIRIVDQFGSNLSMNPQTAEVSADSALDPFSSAVGLAFDHNVAGSTASTAYALDGQTFDLVRIGGIGGTPPPGSGEVTVVGSTGVAFSEYAGFDISPSGTAYAVLSPPDPSGAPQPSQLYTVNLDTGAASVVGTVGPPPGLRIVAMAVAPAGGGQSVIAIPALGPAGLLFLGAGLGLAGILHLRRLRPVRR